MAAVLVATALVLRAAVALPDAAPLPQRLMPELVALAAMCGAGLLIRRAPQAAWLAVAVAAGIAAVEMLAVCRGVLSAVEPGDRPLVVIVAALGGSSAGAVALAYAASTRPPARRRGAGRAMTAFVAAGVVTCVAASVWGVATSNGAAATLTSGVTDDGAVRAMNRWLLSVVALGIAVGLAGHLKGAFHRARQHVRSGFASGSRSPLLSALADELLPIRGHERQRAIEAERARLAADLHATVLPELRHAAAAAASGASPEVAASLRRSLDDVERLMQERQSIVLDEFGLLAALEWLAERTEDRSGLVVEIQLKGERVAERDAVPLPVGRAAFRVALLALDNVARHAAARRVVIRVEVGADDLRMSVEDDGGGRWDPEGRHPGRGLVDMRRTVASIRGQLAIASHRDGTTVTIKWTAGAAAEHPATVPAEVAARVGALDV